MIKIESGIPIPAKRYSSKEYPFKLLEVGESFTFPVELRNRYQTEAHRVGKELNTKYTIRLVGKECRCWRIK